MIEKNFFYWNLHKKIYKKELDKLDNTILNKIMADPRCEESYNLNKRAEIEVEREMTSGNYK